MDNTEFLVNVFDKNDSTKFFISCGANLEKLIKIIEIYLEDLKGKSYSLFYNKINLKALDKQIRLSEILNSKTDNGENILSDKIELIIEYYEEDVSYLNIECTYESQIKHIKISKQFIFQKLKFNLLALFPELEEENYSLYFMNNDITNFYADDKLLSEIFPNNDQIKLSLDIKPKKIVEYHKRCSFCINKKAVSICNKCALSSCAECSIKDIHEKIHFTKIETFKQFEQTSLDKFLKMLKNTEQENYKLNSTNYDENMKQKYLSIEKFYDSILDLITQIKMTQISNMKQASDLIKNKFRPEKLESLIKSFYNVIFNYKTDPFCDVEESLKKILEFEKMLKILSTDFEGYCNNINNLEDKIVKAKKVNDKIFNSINQNLLETKVIFKQDFVNDKHYPIMKVYDDKSILIYNNDSENFQVMNFLDVNGKFRENFNNYVQYNYTSVGLLFIVTGNPCQQLFCYNINTNEMEYVNSLKFNHNWWPVLLIKKSPVNKTDISILCLSGSYSKKCEELKFKLEETNMKKEINLEWNEIASTNVSHGQASGFVVNENIVYVLFGYDCYLNSIAQVERLELGGSQWEILNFSNPDSISSILYYHANLKYDDDNIFIVGGLKEIGQHDVVYKFDINNLNLIKTTHKLELGDVKFCNEKNFVLINKNSDPEEDIYVIFDSKNNLHKIRPKTFEYNLKEFV